MRTNDTATAEPDTAAADPSAQETRATDAELSVRFQRDVIPLLEALHGNAARITRNHEDAEDLVQETMVKAYSRFCSFQHGSNIGAWMYRIMMNTYINAYRKNRRTPVCYPTEHIANALLAGAALHASPGLRSAEDEALEILPRQRDSECDVRAARKVPRAGVLRRCGRPPLRQDREDRRHTARNSHVQASPWAPATARAAR